ncbi:glycosyltransferase [Coprobacillaceae bacterium CR2/5/TPMF4]|nr:glycosyltransferase [Coprobacillaceae bacterium CR2/5/TPMF4]
MEDDYKSIIEKYSNQHIINYYGFQDDVKPFIERCHCFILPSYHEGMANTLLEAAAMGRPLITSNIHGCKEAIDDNGYVCLVKNSEDLYLKIKKFLQLDIKNKKILGLNSRKRVEAFLIRKKL